MLRIAWNDRYILTLPPGHRFPMQKYELLPHQLLHEGTIEKANLFSPCSEVSEFVLSTHAASYWNKLKTLTLSPREVRRTGFPLSQELIDREVTIVNGTLACVDYAMEWGIAMNVAGGTHHAFTDKGEGFCLLNDQAIAAKYVLSKKPEGKVLIVDLDVHQGNGTAEIFKEESRVFTFSVHGANNYPALKEHSDLDVPLPDHTGDATYLATLENILPGLMERIKPDFIFYQAGVDILSTDKLGKLDVSREGCKARDLIVLSLARKYRVPVVVCMGGGYSPEIKDIVEAHSNTFRLAQDLFF
jgi:acetoin utilization deacetylase AcuC-like enzyme